MPAAKKQTPTNSLRYNFCVSQPGNYTLKVVPDPTYLNHMKHIASDIQKIHTTTFLPLMDIAPLQFAFASFGFKTNFLL